MTNTQIPISDHEAMANYCGTWFATAVTGVMGGIGRACVQALLAHGATVSPNAAMHNHTHA